MFNFNTQTYEEIDTRPFSFNTDVVVELDITGGINDYIETGTGNIQTRAGWRATGFVINFPWTVSVDHVLWSGAN